MDSPSSDRSSSSSAVDPTPATAARRTMIIAQHTSAAGGSIVPAAAAAPAVQSSSARSDSHTSARVGATDELSAQQSDPRPELVPLPFAHAWFAGSRTARAARRWMGRKFALGQDLFLIGGAGPMRRWVALSYAARLGREVEYLCLSRDSSESDLKQRREIGPDGSSTFVNQCVVDAAMHGRILLLEGLEHAERNVLPVLNNLLENREMSLEDGSFLVSPARYAQLAREAAARGEAVNGAHTLQRLIPVHADFRVIALGVPVPPMKGQPLDPPLRSRFQAHRVDALSIEDVFAAMVSSVGRDALPIEPVQRMLSFAEAVRALTSKQSSLAGVEARVLAFQHLPPVPEVGMLAAAQLLALFPGQPLEDVLASIYPWSVAITNEEARSMIAGVWNHMIASVPATSTTPDPNAAAGPKPPAAAGTAFPKSSALPAAPVSTPPPIAPTLQLNPALPRFLLSGARRSESLSLDEQQGVVSLASPLPTDVILEFRKTRPDAAAPAPVAEVSVVRVRVRGGTGSGRATLISPPDMPARFTGGPMHHATLSAMLASHAVGRDIALLGGKGEGKSFLVHQFARLLGYLPLEPLFLFKDMSARDLVQRRTTTPEGATVWKSSPLVEALQSGRLAVLDGIDRLPLGTLSLLDRLMLDRELQLFDGSRYLRADRFAELLRSGSCTAAQLAARKVYPIHPSFRIIVLAALPDALNPWLQPDALSQFAFHVYSLQINHELTSGALAGSALTSDSARSLLPSISQILLTILPAASPPFLRKLQHFAARVDQLSADPVIQLERGMLSLRQMIRIVRYEIQLRQGGIAEAIYRNSMQQQAQRAGQTLSQMQSREESLATLAADKIKNVLMLRYLPASKRDVICAVLAQVGLLPASAAAAASHSSSSHAWSNDGESVESLVVSTEQGLLTIGGVSLPLHTPTHADLVPSDFVFYPIPLHLQLMRAILIDLQAGEHICLLGNQGVGKNKITDRLLQLLRRERVYIQLHRDTTVSSLTLSPSLVRGRVIYEDSPLVKAMQGGFVFVVDEVDKAPMEVIVVLKALLEDGEVLLADGRRFVTSKSPIWHMLQKEQRELNNAGGSSSVGSNRGESLLSLGDFHAVHPGFVVFALANPPGFPFLGNDFFAQLGDVFACMAIENPDAASEGELIKAYGPKVDPEVRTKLVAVFQELRQLNREGVLSYPYSTRELVAIVKHLNAFPRDSLAEIIRNCLDFDAWDSHVLHTLVEVFAKHGILVQGLFAQEIARVKGEVNVNAALSASSAAKLPVALSRSFPLPPALHVGSIFTEDASRFPSFNSSTFSVVPGAVERLRAYKPQSHELPVSSILRDEEGRPAKPPANAPSSSNSSSSSTQALLDSSGRLDWRACDRHYSSRASAFTEELFHFTHTGPGLLPAVASTRASANSSLPTLPSSVFAPSFKRGFVHMILLRPFSLVTYDLSASRPMWSSVHLTTQIVRYWNDEEFSGVSMLVLPGVQRVVVLVPQFAALLVIDPFAPAVQVLSVWDVLGYSPAGRAVDRFQDTQVPVLMRLVSAEHSIISLTVQGSSKLSFIDLSCSPARFQSFALSTSVKIFALDQTHADRLCARDHMQRMYDLTLVGASWLGGTGSAAAGSTPLVDRIECSEVKLRLATDPALVDLHMHFLSGALPPALIPAYLAKEHSLQLSTSAALAKAQGTGHWRYTRPAAAPTGPAAAGLPSNLHLWMEEDLICGYMVGLPSGSASIATAAALPASSKTSAQTEPRTTLATLFAHTRAQERPAVASNAASPASPGVSSVRQTTPLRSLSTFLPHSQQFVNVLSYEREVVLELIDVARSSMRVISLPRPPRNSNAEFSVDAGSEHHVISAIELSDGRLALLARSGTIRVFELRETELANQERAWRSMLGAGSANGGSNGGDDDDDDDDGGPDSNRSENDDNDKDDKDGPDDKSGDDGSKNDGDDTNNNKQSGSKSKGKGKGQGKGKSKGEGDGGEGTGSGGVGKGKGGKGKGGGGGSGGGGGGAGGMLSDLNFNRASTLTPEQLRQRDINRAAQPALDSEAVLAKAKEAARKATGKVLDPTRAKMGLDADLYTRLFNAVAKEVSQLRVVLESAEAREQERVWLKNSLSGELDDNKLVDSSVGAKNIYKRRGLDPTPNTLQKRPKRIRFVMDLSSSMARFNAQDRRLDRMVATTVMIMESFSGLSHKFDYSLVGQDGGSPLIPLIGFGAAPTTQKARMDIVEQMIWNASFCESGDHTLAAAAHAITEVVKEEGDDYFVFVLSDANLGGYGITGESLAQVLLADKRVSTYAIFIAGEAQALPLTKMLPLGHGHVCTDTAQLPRIFKTIFSEALVKARTSKL